MTYLQILEKITKDLLTDLASLRVWLVILAYIFNFVVLYLVGFKGVDWKLLTVSIGMLTVVYGFWFTSKHVETIRSNQKNDSSDDTESK